MKMNIPLENIPTNEINPKSAIVNSKKRYLSIDIFRGVTIVAMVFVNFIAEYSQIPSWCKHAPDIGLTFVDLVAPFFIFAISLTYHMNYIAVRKTKSAVETFMHFFRRYMTILGLGLLIGITFTPTAIIFYWSALPAIGLAGFFTLLFIRFPREIRLVIAILGLILYQLILSLTVQIEGNMILISNWNLSDVHGGFIGGFGFFLMMLLGTVISEGLEQKKYQDFVFYGIIFTLIGFVMHLFWVVNPQDILWGISKNRVSISYIFISLGLASIVFYITWYLYDKLQITKGKSVFLQPQGKNAFFLYLFHGILIEIIHLFVPVDLLWTWVLVIAILCIGTVWFMGFMLDQKKIYFIV
jgi:predicted acyltransferase